MEEREDVPASKVLTVAWAEFLADREVEEERRVEIGVVQMAVFLVDSLEVEMETEVEEYVEMEAAAMVSCLGVEMVDRTDMFQSIGRLQPGTSPLPRKHQGS